MSVPDRQTVYILTVVVFLAVIRPESPEAIAVTALLGAEIAGRVTGVWTPSHAVWERLSRLFTEPRAGE